MNGAWDQFIIEFGGAENDPETKTKEQNENYEALKILKLSYIMKHEHTVSTLQHLDEKSFSTTIFFSKTVLTEKILR